MKTRHNRKGSALIVALILGVILLTGLSALIGTTVSEVRGTTRSYMNTAALHLAEAGIEKAADGFVKNESWVASADGFRDTSLVVASYPSSFVVTATRDGSTHVVFRSLGRVSNPGGKIVADRAVEARFKLVGGGGPTTPDFSLVTGESVLQFTGQRGETLDKGTHNVVASFPSNVSTARKPPLAGQEALLTYQGGVWITTSNTSQANVQNTVVLGKVRTDGATLSTASQSDNGFRMYTSDARFDPAAQNTATNLDPAKVERSATTYTYPPTDINLDNRTSTILPQNQELTPNTVTRIGQVGAKTYYEVDKLELGNGKTLEIVGDVVLVVRGSCNVRQGAQVKIGAVNQSGGIVPDMTVPPATCAKLTLIATNEAIAVDGPAFDPVAADRNGLWLPRQLTLTTKYRFVTGSGTAVTALGSNPYTKSTAPVSATGTKGVTVHANFTGTINNPGGTVNLHGSGRNSQTIWGQVFAKRTEQTNAVRVFYDPSLNDGGGTGDSLQLATWRQIVPPADLRAKL